MFSFSSLISNLCRIRNGPLLSAQPCAGLNTSISKKLGLPPKPKRPSTSYCLFVRKALPEIRVRYPKLSRTEQFRVAGEQWRHVDPKILSELEDLAAKERIKYSQAIDKYNALVTPEDKIALKEAEEAKKLSKEKRCLKKKLTDLGMPKKPVNAFLQFVSEWSSKNPKASQKEAIQKCAALWKGLNEEERGKYYAIFKKLDEDYQKKLRIWEAEMMKQGKLEVTYDSLLKKSFSASDTKPSKSG